MSNWCTKCGNCCKEMHFPLENAGEDIINWLNYHEKTEVVEVGGKRWIRIELPCEHLKDNKCSTYETRPTKCRIYNEQDCKYFYEQEKEKTKR